jgi:CRISPR-associated protein Cmr2
MSDAVLIFTFSPVQSFIAEARRASDLYAGSQILVELAKAAAGQVLRNGGELIYPAMLDVGDAPNVLVAKVLWGEVETIACEAAGALHKCWKEIAEKSRVELVKRLHQDELKPDAVWDSIWKRQVEERPFWEVYWAAASMPEGRSYKDAYLEADRGKDASKRARFFVAAEEPNLKDSLGGAREALHTAQPDARTYWAKVAEQPQITAAMLRAGGRERLDALGVVKRFYPREAHDHTTGFPSTSTVASRGWLEHARHYLGEYRQAVEKLLGRHLYRVSDDNDWPYDGDLLFMETLTQRRLHNSYGLTEADRDLLDSGRSELSRMYDKTRSKPSPYYVILVLDGDSIGKRIRDLLTQSEPEEAHRGFSRNLSEFADKVRGTARNVLSSVVYNGGDDVLALSPLSQALLLARNLAKDFENTTKGTASGGLVVAHHLYPLDAALDAARQAERRAKSAMDGAKAAVCIKTIRRGGERMTVYSPWAALGDNFDELVGMFRSRALASRFPYEVMRSAYALPGPDEKLQSELKRLLQRHRDGKHPQAPDPEKWARRLTEWAENMPAKSVELGQWLALARFVAQGGGE